MVHAWMPIPGQAHLGGGLQVFVRLMCAETVGDEMKIVGEPGLQAADGRACRHLRQQRGGQRCESQ